MSTTHPRSDRLTGRRRPGRAPTRRQLLVGAAVGAALGVPGAFPLLFVLLALSGLVLQPLGLAAPDSTFDEGSDFYVGLGGVALAVCVGLVVLGALLTSRLLGLRATALWWLCSALGFVVPFAVWWALE